MKMMRTKVAIMLNTLSACPSFRPILCTDQSFVPRLSLGPCVYFPLKKPIDFHCFRVHKFAVIIYGLPIFLFCCSSVSALSNQSAHVDRLYLLGRASWKSLKGTVTMKVCSVHLLIYLQNTRYSLRYMYYNILLHTWLSNVRTDSDSEQAGLGSILDTVASCILIHFQSMYRVFHKII